VILRLGIDIAVRAPHQASLANERGELLWSGHRFRTSAKELEALWSKVQGMTAEAVTVVMEPTRNAWVPLAAWFRRRGADVVLIPPERSADLRAYYAKHTKSDRLDSVLLARLPLLHPEACTRSGAWAPACQDRDRTNSKPATTSTHRPTTHAA